MPWLANLGRILGLASAETVPKPIPSLTADWDDADFDELCSIAEACSTPKAICRPQYLLSVMWIEGAGARADAANPSSSATGILQWMGQNTAKPGEPKVYRWYGRTRDQFKALGVRGQLPIVRGWFLAHKGYLSSVETVYTAVFLPAFVKQAAADEAYVLCSETSQREILRSAYMWNKHVFDKNKDGQIQVWELGVALKGEIVKGGRRCEELFTRLRDAEARRAA
jgi:hypothetical protein